jgi:nucleotide-binding universal stress UspA family protein
MSYKTILVHIDDSPLSRTRLQAGIALARRFDAHLIGAALSGVSRLLYQVMPSAASDPTLAQHLDFVRERAQQAVAQCTAQLQEAQLVSYEARLIDDEAGEGIALHARGADLVLVGQADPEHMHPDLPADFAAHVVLHAGRPVLVLPFGAAPASIATRALVCWDGGKEAARALAMALPLLKRANLVQLVVFDTGGASRTAQDALAASPVEWLARHGVTAMLTVHKIDSRRRHAVGEALLATAGEHAADLLVMGAYGHSRLRETILGGVTRTVLEEMSLPVLMVH